MSGSDRNGEKHSTDDLLFIRPFTKVRMHPIRCRRRHSPILEFIIIFTILPDADTSSVAGLEFPGLSAPYLCAGIHRSVPAGARLVEFGMVFEMRLVDLFVEHRAGEELIRGNGNVGSIDLCCSSSSWKQYNEKKIDVCVCVCVYV